MKNLMFKDLVAFVMEHKKDKVYTGYADHAIVDELFEAMTAGTLLYSTDAEGNMSGMVLAIKNEKTKTLDVRRNLALSLKNLRVFAAEAKRRCPDFKLVWHKHNIFKSHNTEHFYHKMHV